MSAPLVAAVLLALGLLLEREILAQRERRTAWRQFWEQQLRP